MVFVPEVQWQFYNPTCSFTAKQTRKTDCSAERLTQTSFFRCALGRPFRQWIQILDFKPCSSFCVHQGCSWSINLLPCWTLVVIWFRKKGSNHCLSCLRRRSAKVFTKNPY